MWTATIAVGGAETRDCVASAQPNGHGSTSWVPDASPEEWKDRVPELKAGRSWKASELSKTWPCCRCGTLFCSSGLFMMAPAEMRSARLSSAAWRGAWLWLAEMRVASSTTSTLLASASSPISSNGADLAEGLLDDIGPVAHQVDDLLIAALGHLCDAFRSASPSPPRGGALRRIPIWQRPP